MHSSKILGKIIGIYLIIISAAMFINMQKFANLVHNLINDEPMMFVSGCFTLILGLVMLVFHNIWQWHWRVIITIIAWITFIKGAMIVLFPQYIDNLSLAFVHNMQFAYISAAIDLILGLILVYFSFKKDKQIG